MRRKKILEVRAKWRMSAASEVKVICFIMSKTVLVGMDTIDMTVCWIEAGDLAERYWVRVSASFRCCELCDKGFCLGRCWDWQGHYFSEYAIHRGWMSECE